jgi:glycyl-tRNA synthetase
LEIRKIFNRSDKLHEKIHSQKELAHYANACVDIEYEFPFGRGEIEGIASRTNTDLLQHAMNSKHSFDISTDNGQKRFYPHIIEPAAGLNRGLLALLHDAYMEEERIGGQKRMILRLHPRLAPFKAAILPLIQKESLILKAQMIVEELWNQDWSISYDEKYSIGKRYARHDEIGTPYCITIDDQTLQDDTITVRHRDSSFQERLPSKEILSFLKTHIYQT